MRKADLLRAAIRKNNAWCRTNPENLQISIPECLIVATGEMSASFEYRYTLQVLLLDFPGDLDEITLPILAWARVHQPELIYNPDVRKDGIRMEADIINTDEMGNAIPPVADIRFSIRATEAVIVNLDENGVPVITHRDEPDYSALLGLGATAWDVVFEDMVSGDKVTP
ncbi:phage tail protein [Gibbsiella dentisursi]|uniref:Phage tail protein n=1 Tax=Gibbsiella dentisursi TaxID=796890 RepID=A0ABP7M2B6_9GAMM